jgi:hypothetical protein
VVTYGVYIDDDISFSNLKAAHGRGAAMSISPDDNDGIAHDRSTVYISKEIRRGSSNPDDAMFLQPLIS